MRIVHVSSYDVTGGAAISAYRLHRALLMRVEDSLMYVGERKSAERDVIQFERPSGLLKTVSRAWRNGWIHLEDKALRNRPSEKLETFSNAITKFGSQSVGGLPECDIVNLHWVAGFMDLTCCFRHIRPPLVWTLHDMNAFTGGCHYDQECKRFTEKCGACPQLASSREKDYSRVAFSRKERAYDEVDASRLYIVTPSKWLGAQVEASPLLRRFDRRVIPYGIDTETFAPREASCLRRTFGIAEEDRVVLFVADQLSSYRKGLDLVEEAFGQSDNERIVLMCIGEPRTPSAPGRVRVIPVGKIADETILSMLYSLADLFVIGSRQDNLPNTVMEAMACGTPVVGFRAGGIPELVREGETGYLACPGDARSLRDAARQILADDRKRGEMSRTCRLICEKEYRAKTQAERYVKLYEEALGSFGKP